MTTNKQASNMRDNIRKRLGESPSQGFLQDMLDTAPLRARMLRLSLDNIQRYEYNPRWTRNPNFDDIKASIRERGLDQPLVVTLRPGDRHHTLKKGGGTRYQILRELWEETRQKRFFELEVVVEPYTNELDLFISHGIENLKRGQMSFIESAKFYCDLKQKHEDHEGRELSTREACERIKRDGFSVDSGLMTKYQYALNLHQFIPQILEMGAGRPVVEKIRKHEKVSRDIWQQHSDDLEQFEQLWGEALAQHDHDDPDLPFDLHGVQVTFENAAGALLNIPPQHLSALVDLALHQPDRTAMSELSSGPSYSPEPAQWAGRSLDTPPSSPAAFTEYAGAPVEPGEYEDDNNQETLTPPNETGVPPTQAAPPKSPRAVASSSTTTAGIKPSQPHPGTPAQFRHGYPSLLPRHIQTDKGPEEGFEALRRHVERELAAWTTPDDHEPVFRAVKTVIVWANTLLSYFRIPALSEAGDPPGTFGFVALSDQLQLHLRAPSEPLTGERVFDHAWLRIAQIFYGPVFLERNDVFMSEFTALFTRGCTSFEHTKDVIDVLQRVLYLHTLSHLVFADPAHAWLDQALHSLQGAANEFLLVRRQQTDTTINPLGPLTPNF